jgi:hypothetical protein
VIETCVRWYLTYRLSYRDLVSLMADERRWNRRTRPVGSSWRVDETYIHTRPKMGYLYRAVDKQGTTVDSLFQTGRGIAAAMAFFARRLRSAHHDGRGKFAIQEVCLKNAEDLSAFTREMQLIAQSEGTKFIERSANTQKELDTIGHPVEGAPDQTGR